MLTNYASPRYEQKCLELGADYFLDKATQFEAVAELVGFLAGSAADAASCTDDRERSPHA